MYQQTHPDPWLTSREAAQILNCSPDDLPAMARRGDIRGRKEGRTWRFSLRMIRNVQRYREETGGTQ